MSSILGGSANSMGCIYNPTPPSAIPGSYVPLQCDSKGRLINAPGGDWSLFTAFNSVSGVVAAAPVRMLGMACRNANGAARYLQLFNRTTAPTAGAVPIYAASLPLKGFYEFNGLGFFGPGGFKLSVGLVIGVSTTESTYTAANPADHSIFVAYQMAT